jgi:hypothetical protein
MSRHARCRLTRASPKGVRSASPPSSAGPGSTNGQMKRSPEPRRTDQDAAVIGAEPCRYPIIALPKHRNFVPTCHRDLGSILVLGVRTQPPAEANTLRVQR